ncbi:hypothetical protein BKA61DRAFT_605381 [Leptodontidium sp. MPI-SDFR-AT-0119]|nr:hypothetical protein BKA61DRAFT_605381 [Leptodontidium sp. MPI-SDFR-AT-0119]
MRTSPISKPSSTSLAQHLRAVSLCFADGLTPHLRPFYRHPLSYSSEYCSIKVTGNIESSYYYLRALTREIRLLNLLLATTSGSLRCYLRRATIGDMPPFISVSYV